MVRQVFSSNAPINVPRDGQTSRMKRERGGDKKTGGKKTALIIHRIMEVSVTENSAIFQLQYLINTGD